MANRGVSVDLADVQAALDRRLDRNAPGPIVFAFSGGGDSLALLHLALPWARRAGRVALALTVDHGLQPDSACWTAQAGLKARALGVDWRALTWTGPKPATGLPAAARKARHALLADAAREAGARVILMGHTLSDVAEGEIMRAGDAPGLGRLREWAPSPVWPEGRGVFLLRPLLEIRREALRDYLRGLNETWLDDPANEDVSNPRIRARLIQKDDAIIPPAVLDPAIPALARRITMFPTGWAVASRGLERSAASRHVLGALLVSLSGGQRPPRPAVLNGVIDAINSHGDKLVRTAGGSRIDIEGGAFTVAAAPARDDRDRRVELTPHTPTVWGSRYEITAPGRGWSIGLLDGLEARLPPSEARSNAALSAYHQTHLAMVREERVRYVSPPWNSQIASARFLGDVRFAAVCGLLRSEREANYYDALPPHEPERSFFMRRTFKPEAAV